MSAPTPGDAQAELPPDATWQTPATPMLDAAAPAAPVPAPPPSATERLEQSRERLRQYLESRRPRQRTTADGEAPSWLDKLRENPISAGVAEAVGAWWEKHPLNKVFMVGESALHDNVAPFARRHPLTLVAAGAVVGALLYRTRLLRRALKPALFAGLTTQIVMHLIDRVPLSAAFDFFGRARGEAPGENTAPAGDPTTAPSEGDLPDPAAMPATEPRAGAASAPPH